MWFIRGYPSRAIWIKGPSPILFHSLNLPSSEHMGHPHSVFELVDPHIRKQSGESRHSLSIRHLPKPFTFILSSLTPCQLCMKHGDFPPWTSVIGQPSLSEVTYGTGLQIWVPGCWAASTASLCSHEDHIFPVSPYFPFSDSLWSQIPLQCSLEPGQAKYLAHHCWTLAACQELYHMVGMTEEIIRTVA